MAVLGTILLAVFLKAKNRPVSLTLFTILTNKKIISYINKESCIHLERYMHSHRTCKCDLNIPKIQNIIKRIFCFSTKTLFNFSEFAFYHMTIICLTENFIKKNFLKIA